MDINDSLRAAFQKSRLISIKLPDAEKRQEFLVKLLESSEHDKKSFLSLLEKGDVELDKAEQNIIESASKTKKKMEAIKHEAREITEDIEQKEKDEGSEDILKKIYG